MPTRKDAISRIDMIAKTGLMAPTANRQGQKLFLSCSPNSAGELATGIILFYFSQSSA